MIHRSLAQCMSRQRNKGFNACIKIYGWTTGLHGDLGDLYCRKLNSSESFSPPLSQATSRVSNWTISSSQSTFRIRFCRKSAKKLNNSILKVLKVKNFQSSTEIYHFKWSVWKTIFYDSDFWLEAENLLRCCKGDFLRYTQKTGLKTLEIFLLIDIEMVS